MCDEDNFDKTLKEREIKRLTTPPKKIKGIYYDCEGTELHHSFTCGYTSEPKKGILTDDEILKYAGDSCTASEIRLKRGIGTQSDKSSVHEDMYPGFVFGGIFLFCIAVASFMGEGNLFGKILFFLVLFLMIGYYIYVMYIKDYTEPEYKTTTEKIDKISSKEDEDKKILSNEELLLLFESKEKIARKMIERKFPAPQMTNTKFNAVIDECKKEVESQVSILNALTPTTKTKHEIASRKKLIKQLISKIDDLTNELILFEENNIEDIIDSMDELINSVKNYK